MKRVIHTVASLLAILIILVAMYVIVLLIHYAIFGNPVKDTQHIIHGIKNTSTVIKKPSTPSSVNASVRPTTAVDYHSAAAVYSSPVHKSVSTPVTAQAPAQSASIVQLLVHSAATNTMATALSPIQPSAAAPINAQIKATYCLVMIRPLARPSVRQVVRQVVIALVSSMMAQKSASSIRPAALTVIAYLSAISATRTV